MSDDDWKTDVDPSNVSKYYREGTDLSPSINQGQIISDLRDLSGLSVAEFAEACGVTKQQILALEAGLQDLSPELATTMAEQLGVQVSDILPKA